MMTISSFRLMELVLSQCLIKVILSERGGTTPQKLCVVRWVDVQQRAAVRIEEEESSSLC